MNDKDKAKEYVISLLNLEKDNDYSILDIGCGQGDDLMQMSKLTGKKSKFCGIDRSEKAIEKAIEKTASEPGFSFQVYDVTKKLPFKEKRFDIVYSNNFLESIINKNSFLEEIYRVLADKGSVIVAHWDWDTIVIDGTDKELIRKIIHTFGDWKQKWMDDCDSWMGRRLWKVFQQSNLFEGEIFTYVLTNTEFAPENFGYDMINDSFEALVRREMIKQEEYDKMYQDVEELSEKGQYFYSINLYIYLGKKK